MNFPIEITIGAFKFNLHLIFESLAFIVGFQYYVFLRKKSKDTITEDNRMWIIVGASAGALLFSRLIGSLENPVSWYYSNHPIFYFYLNKTIVGGLVGGLLGVEVVKYFIGEKKSSGDLFTLPLILGMMIGRVGCFSMGVHEPTYGVETDMSWGMNLGDGLYRHPTSLYEILFLGILGFVLKKIWALNHFKEGLIFQFFLISYLLFRFFIEYIKPTTFFYFRISAIQMTCLIGLLYYRKTLFFLIFNQNNLKKSD